MQEMLRGLGLGLALAIVVIFLLLSANFQSWKMAFVTVSTVPAVVAGVVLMLWITRTTLNLQSFMGTIMAIGVAMANGILLVTLAENRRRTTDDVLSATAAINSRVPNRAAAAAVEGASRRLRPILDDLLCHDCRHAAAGVGSGRRRAADRTAGSRSHRRSGDGNTGDIGGAAVCVLSGSVQGQGFVSVA